MVKYYGSKVYQNYNIKILMTKHQTYKKKLHYNLFSYLPFKN